MKKHGPKPQAMGPKTAAKPKPRLRITSDSLQMGKDLDVAITHVLTMECLKGRQRLRLQCGGLNS